jgi:salicylate hydroxylase
VLGELLRLPACTKETIPAFLQAYEAVRRPRASRQQEHARESGEVSRALRGAPRSFDAGVMSSQVFEFASPLGGDWEKIAGDMPHRFDWIWTHDLTEDVGKAKEQLKAQGLL